MANDLVMTQALPEVEQLNPRDLLGLYVGLRDLRTQVREREKAITARMEAIQARLQQVMLDLGTDSFSAMGYVAYQTELNSVSVDDPLTFEQFVRQQGNLQLIDLRPNKEAVMTWRAIHNEVPPGLRLTRLARVNVRKG